MPIQDPILRHLIANQTLEQILSGPDVTPAVADLQPLAEELFSKYKADIRNDPDRLAENALHDFVIVTRDQVRDRREIRQVRAITFDGMVMRYTTATQGNRPATGYP